MLSKLVEWAKSKLRPAPTKAAWPPPLTVSRLCLNLVKEFEGLRLQAYRCPAGKWTVGYGATGPDIGPGTTWTTEQAEADLRQRLDRVARQLVFQAKRRPLSQVSLDAFTSFAYNVGVGGCLGSSAWEWYQAGDTARAADALLLWNKARGVVLPGLTRRRAAERDLLRRELGK